MTEQNTTQQVNAAALRADQRLVGLHRERGDAHRRLEDALASLEGADWGMSLAGEAALAQQLRAILGAGVLRLDGRLPLRRDLLAEAGLAAAGLDGDLRGAVGVWLLEPDAATMRRARDAGVPIIVDATLAPGSGWLTGQRGQMDRQVEGQMEEARKAADYVVYHHGATLTGFGEVELALLLGRGQRPEAVAPAPTDLATAHTLRDIATLPLRLARAASTAQQLLERLGGRALGVGPTALLLPPETALTTAAPLGGVLPAVRPVAGGLLLTPGLLDAPAVLGAVGLSESSEVVSDAMVASVPSAPKHRPEGSKEPEGRPKASDSQEMPQLQTTDNGGVERFVFEPDTAPAVSSQPEVSGQTEPAQPAQPSEQRERGQGDIGHDRQRDRSRQRREARSNGSNRRGNGSQRSKGEPEEQRARSQRAGDKRRGEGKQRSEGGQRRDTAAAPHLDLSDLAPDLPLSVPKDGKADPTAHLTSEQVQVFDRLREWRNEEAARQSISRFIIASNVTLAAIARQVPYTAAELASVKGMGPARMERYGEAILRVVRGNSDQ